MQEGIVVDGIVRQSADVPTVVEKIVLEGRIVAAVDICGI
jgi:hypothetical protein